MTYNLLSIFVQSFKAANSGINVTPGFPVYDTMIKPNEKAFETLSTILSDLERSIDYSRFFDESGVLERDADYEILKNNMFLGDGVAVRSSGQLLLEYTSLQTSIIIGSDLKVEREGVVYAVAPGTYSPAVHSISGRYIRYAFRFTAEESGTGSISAGDWAVTGGSLPSGCVRAFTIEITSAGSNNAGVLTRDNLPLLLSQKAGMNAASIMANITQSLASAGLIPDRMTAVGYSDQEYLSGVIPFEDENNTVRVFRFGGYVDVRFHRGFAIEEFYFENGEPLANGLFRYVLENPVYAVTSVRNWITGEDGSDIPFSFDYIENSVTTAHSRIRIAVLTTPSDIYGYVRSAIAELFTGAGTVKLIPFFSIRLYADEDCIPAGSSDLLEEVNTALSEYFSTGSGPGEFTFTGISDMIRDATGVICSKLKYILPDGNAGEFNAGSFSGFSIEYGLQDLKTVIPLTARNTVIAGGYTGASSYDIGE